MQIVQSMKMPGTSTPIDRLSSLLERFRVRASLFHAGPLCGVTHFDAMPGRAFLHVLRRGETVVSHPARSGGPRRIAVLEPTLLFYPRPLEHSFANPPAEGADFVCATLDFDGGEQHPLVRALPPVVLLRLRDLPETDRTLELLFGETASVRCGQRLLANRLFEVLLLQLLRWLLDHPEVAGVPTGLLAGLSDPRLARALTAMHERPGDHWTLDSLAAAAGMSRSSFAAAFRHTVGITPKAYLLSWRVTLAQSMLRLDTPVGTVSDRLGYTSAGAFARAFAQVVGQAPRAWQRSLP